MHSYLRAIGFSKYKSRRQLENIYSQILKNANRKIITTISVDTSLVQFEKDFGNGIGICLLGECDVNGSLSIEHYYPYIKGDFFMEYENITIEKQTDKESYAGVCSDYRLGMTLIFYLQNIADYAKSKWFNYSNRNLSTVKLSGLCNSGAVLLGIKRDERQLYYEKELKKLKYHLLTEAKNGNSEALETLTIDEMNTYKSIENRIKTEDILSIIDTSVMPCGVECDHYMVLGNILRVTEVKNEFTDEIIYNLLLEANDIVLNVGINKLDLQGEPAVGRRFRGEVWLQGYVRI